MIRTPSTGPARNGSHLVAALAYEGLCTFEFGCTVELFALDRPELDVPWYEFAVCATETGFVRAAGGIEIRAPHSLALLEQADTVVVPGWRNVDEPVPGVLMEVLRAAATRGARICSICSGAFVLAAAGLLDGRRATTHWRYAARLAERYPDIIVESDALYVDEGTILTSAGSAAGLDMLVHLVRTDHGIDIANAVARRLVIPPLREGGQAQYVPRPVAGDAHGRLSRLLDWTRANITMAHTVESLAARAAVSPRTLQREFRAGTGLAVHAWLTRERVACAMELLETGLRPMEQVARRAGFGSVESLRHHFRQQLDTTPVTYAARFGPAPPT